MALSQKHVGKMLVPWFNSNEWKYVKNLIFASHSTNIEKTQALEILQMWKVRTPKLPSGVEGTLIILDALLQTKGAVSDDKLHIFYGASIMRFLNLCGAGSHKQGTLYKTAKQNNLPDWLVDLRHDIAHDQIIPSRFMLQLGLEYCLDWLKHNYWEKQCATIQDFVIREDPERNIKTLVELYCQINLAQHLQSNIKNIQDINQNPSIIEKICCLGSDEINTDMDVKDVLSILLQNIDDYITCQDEQQPVDLIAETIVADGSIFATTAHQCENGKEELPRDFIVIWQNLINLLCMKNMLLPLVKKLIILSGNVEMVEHIRKIASLWLAEISKCLLLAKHIYDKYNDIPDHDKLNKETAVTVLKKVTQNENPKLRVSLNLDVEYCKAIVDDISSIQKEALSDPHIFTLNFLIDFLQVCGCTQEYINTIELLVNSYLYPRSDFFETLDQLHTIKEFATILGRDTDSLLNSDTDTLFNSDTTSLNSVSPTENVNVLPSATLNGNTEAPAETPEDIPPKRWRIVEDTSIFKGCPLGVLAYQDRSKNPLLLQKSLC